MELVTSEEQEALEGVLKDVLATSAPPDRVAAVADGPEDHDEELHRVLVGQLGLGGLLVDAGRGGLDATWREVATVLGQLGRVLAPVPFMSSCVLAPTVLARAQGQHADDLAAATAAGTTRLAVALPSTADPVSMITVAATQAPAGTVVSGVVDHVVDGVGAAGLLVLALDEHASPVWCHVDAQDPGVTLVPERVVDATRPSARLELAAAGATVLISGAAADQVVEDVVDAGARAVACELAASSADLLDVTVAHARTRLQFGQPIGSFQAVQHRLADLAVLVDESRSAVALAVWSACDAPDRARADASLALVVCAEAARTVAAEAIQVHGGIGFTWDHVCHRHYRRAMASAVRFGRPSEHRERLLRASGL